MTHERRVDIGKIVYTPEGFRVTAFSKNKIRHARSGATAYHEAIHVVAAEANGTSVVKATIIPGNGYLGLTQLSKPDAVAAVAPHAFGCDGTSHDLSIVASMGVDKNAASNAAKGILSQKQDHIEIIAGTLEEQKTINSHDVRNAIDIAENGIEVVVFIRDPEGGSREFTGLRSKESHVNISHEWIPALSV